MHPAVGTLFLNKNGRVTGGTFRAMALSSASQGNGAHVVLPVFQEALCCGKEKLRVLACVTILTQTLTLLQRPT